VVIDTAGMIYAFKFEAEFKMALSPESGPQGGLFDEKKTEGQKSRHTVLFKISAPKF
jgi:hypothetical protein